MYSVLIRAPPILKSGDWGHGQTKTDLSTKPKKSRKVAGKSEFFKKLKEAREGGETTGDFRDGKAEIVEEMKMRYPGKSLQIPCLCV